jgi:hypothetical protein
MDADEIVDSLSDTVPGDRIWIETEGIEGWFVVESARREYGEPERDQGGWVEGELTRYLIVPDGVRDGRDLVYHSGYLSAKTDGGEWHRPTIELPEEGDADDWRGEYREVQSATAVPEEMWEYREAALAESYSLRVTALRRAIHVDAAARYAASEQTCDVWWEYADEAEEESLNGFVGWLEAESLRELWDEVGERMFTGEDEEGDGDGLMDVEDRALTDSLSTLRYFHRSS